MDNRETTSWDGYNPNGVSDPDIAIWLDRCYPGTFARISVHTYECSACLKRGPTGTVKIKGLRGVFTSPGCELTSLCPRCAVLLPFVEYLSAQYHRVVPTTTVLEDVVIPRTNPSPEPTIGSQTHEMRFLGSGDEPRRITIPVQWAQIPPGDSKAALYEKTVESNDLLALNPGLTVPIGFRLPPYEQCSIMSFAMYDNLVRSACNMLLDINQVDPRFVLCDKMMQNEYVGQVIRTLAAERAINDGVTGTQAHGAADVQEFEV